MSTFDDLSTDPGRLRNLVADKDSVSPFFSDAALDNLLLQANAMVPIISALPLSKLYWAAYLGWMEKAGDKANKSKIQKIVVLSKNTHVTYGDAVAQALNYRQLSHEAVGSGSDGVSGILVAVPTLDTTAARVDRSVAYPWSSRNDLLGEEF